MAGARDGITNRCRHN